MLEVLKKKLYWHIKVPGAPRDLPVIQALMSELVSTFPACMHVYNILLHSFILMNDAHGIRLVLKRIQDSGMSYNKFTYNLLMGYYRNSKAPLEAERLLDQMIQAGLQPDRYAYTTLITAFADHSPQKACYYFDQIKELAAKDQNQAPDMYTYNAILGSLIRHSHFEAAEAILAEIRERGFNPDKITYKVLIESLLRQFKHSEAEQLLKTALQDPSIAFSPYDLSELFLFFWNQRAHASALELLAIVRSKYPDRIAPSVVVRSLISFRLLEDDVAFQELWDQQVLKRPDFYMVEMKRLSYSPYSRPADVRDVLNQLKDKLDGLQ